MLYKDRPSRKRIIIEVTLFGLLVSGLLVAATVQTFTTNVAMLATVNRTGQVAARTTGSDCFLVGQGSCITGGSITGVTQANVCSLETINTAASGAPSGGMSMQFRNNANSGTFLGGYTDWVKRAANDKSDFLVATSAPYLNMSCSHENRCAIGEATSTPSALTDTLHIAGTGNANIKIENGGLRMGASTASAAASTGVIRYESNLLTRSNNNGAFAEILAVPGSTSITTLGTITAGTWQGTDIAAGYLADTAVTPGSYTSTNLTVDAQGRITAASNGTAGTTDYYGTYTAVCAAGMGVSATNMDVYYDDCNGMHPWLGNANGLLANHDQGGWCEKAATYAVAGQSTTIVPQNALFDNTGKWCIVWRGKLPTTGLGTASQIGVGLIDSTVLKQITTGAHGTGSTPTVYNLYADGLGVIAPSSGATIDSSIHIHVAYANGTTISYYVCNATGGSCSATATGAESSVTNPGGGAQNTGGPWIVGTNGGSVKADFVLIAGERL